jgi:hypothetical protein
MQAKRAPAVGIWVQHSASDEVPNCNSQRLLIMPSKTGLDQ